MAQQGPTFDMSKVGTADKIILGAAGAYFIWMFLPFWYNCCSIFGATVPAGTYSGFRSFAVVIAWLLSILAIAEIVVSRILGTELKIPGKRGQIHLGLAGGAVLFTLLGLVAKSTGYTIAWGIFVAIILAGAWAYGAYMLFSMPDTVGPADQPPPMP